MVTATDGTPEAREPSLVPAELEVPATAVGDGAFQAMLASATGASGACQMRWDGTTASWSGALVALPLPDSEDGASLKQGADVEHAPLPNAPVTMPAAHEGDAVSDRLASHRVRQSRDEGEGEAYLARCRKEEVRSTRCDGTNR